MSDNPFQSLIDALNNNAEAMNRFVAHVEKAGGTKTTTAPATTAKATTKPATTKPTKKLTVEDVKKEFTEYLGISDKEVRAERVGHVSALTEHFGVPRITEVAEGDYALALHYLSLYKKGLTPTFSGLEDEGVSVEDEGGSEEPLI